MTLTKTELRAEAQRQIRRFGSKAAAIEHLSWVASQRLFQRFHLTGDLEEIRYCAEVLQELKK